MIFLDFLGLFRSTLKVVSLLLYFQAEPLQIFGGDFQNVPLEREISVYSTCVPSRFSSAMVGGIVELDGFFDIV